MKASAWKNYPGHGGPGSELAIDVLPIDRFAPSTRRGRAEYERCIHHLFESQAKKTPRAVAVICDRETLTYGELDRRATALAGHLQARGVRPETIVAVCVERSIEMVVGLLAVLKAGGAYLPLDPSHPPQRLAFALADSAAQLLLTQRALVNRFPETSVPTVCLDQPWELSSCGTRRADMARARPDNLAYVIYTSGSTGDSKGVMIDHRSAVNTLIDVNRRFGIGAGDRVLALSSFGFDLSVYDIFGLLAVGGVVVLPEPQQTRDPAHWARLVAEQRITVWNTVPALMEMLVDYAASHAELDLGSLRTVLLSGDWIAVNLPDRVRNLCPAAQVISLGGATEGSIWSIFYPVDVVASNWPSIPYGMPLANQQVYVLDESLRVCRAGESGELYIGGLGVARGYLNRPQLNQERFVDAPWLGHHGDRLYRTGDLGRRLDDGNIQFLGRIDNQVKIHGNRIEPGEIEVALARHPQIVSCVVVARQTMPGDKQLVAYTVSRDLRGPTSSELREFLGEVLPDYMIPRRFVALQQLPLTPNGKLDRNALPDPRNVSATRSAPPAPPADAIESKLLAIWRKLFDDDSLGVDDSFFDLGGDSLLAVGLLTGVQHAFSQSPSIDVLLECPTVRLLASLLRDSTVTLRSGVVAIQPQGGQRPLFCVPGIGGSLLEFRNLADQLCADQPVYGLEPCGMDGVQTPHRSIKHMAAYNIRGMQSVQPRGPYRLVGYSLGGVVAFEMAQQLSARGEPVELLALLDAPWEETSESLPVWQRLAIHFRHLRYRDMTGRWRYLCGRLRSIRVRIGRGFLKQPENELVERLELSPASRRLARAHWPAWKEYVPQCYPGRITVFRAADQPDRPRNKPLDPYQGWLALASNGIDVYTVPGAHLEIFRKENVGVLARQLQESLRQHCRQPMPLVTG